MSGRLLTADEQGVIGAILRGSGAADAAELAAQLQVARVVGDTVTFLRFDGHRSGNLAARHGDGELGTSAITFGLDGEPIGFINVWVEGGYLDFVEYSWFTGEPPLSYPSPERIRVVSGDYPGPMDADG